LKTTVRPEIEFKQIAHLLRTPLTVMGAQSKLAQISPLSSDLLEDLATLIYGQVSVMSRILDDLQFLIGSQQPELEIESDEIDVAKIALEVAKERNIICAQNSSHTIPIIGNDKYVRVMIQRMLDLLEYDEAKDIQLSISDLEISVIGNGINSTLESSNLELEQGKFGRQPVLMLAVIHAIADLLGFDFETNVDAELCKLAIKRREQQ
jgi:K+-sensing histidine kinase KdpD